MYKSQDQEEYKTTTIRMRRTHYNTLKDIASADCRSDNYLINKVLIEYIINKEVERDFIVFE